MAHTRLEMKTLEFKCPKEVVPDFFSPTPSSPRGKESGSHGPQRSLRPLREAQTDSGPPQ